MANRAAQTAARPSLRTQDDQLGRTFVHELRNRRTRIARADEAHRDGDAVKIGDRLRPVEQSVRSRLLLEHVRLEREQRWHFDHAEDLERRVPIGGETARNLDRAQRDGVVDDGDKQPAITGYSCMGARRLRGNGHAFKLDPRARSLP
jgi:hypothetical protein